MNAARWGNLFAGLLLVGAILVIDAFGRRWGLDDSTRSFLLGTAGVMLWQIRGWFADGPGGRPSPPSLLVLGLLVAVSCARGAAVPLDPAASACVAKRTIRQLECVDLYTTRTEIDACRARVVSALDCVDGGAP